MRAASVWLRFLPERYSTRLLLGKEEERPLEREEEEEEERLKSLADLWERTEEGKMGATGGTSEVQTVRAKTVAFGLKVLLIRSYTTKLTEDPALRRHKLEKLDRKSKVKQIPHARKMCKYKFDGKNDGGFD